MKPLTAHEGTWCSPVNANVRRPDGQLGAGRILGRWSSAETQKKAVANVTRRGISFAEASTVLEDPLSTTFPDEAHSEGEMRFLTIGTSHRGRLLVVAHTERNDTVRIISARRATRREREFYAQDDPTKG